MTFEGARENFQNKKMPLICEFADPIQGPLAEFWCHDCKKAICKYCTEYYKEHDRIIAHGNHKLEKL